MKLESRWVLGIALGCALLVGCASSGTYEEALTERDAEIQALREERTAVKGENRDLQAQTKILDAQLAEANAKLLAEPTKTRDFPDLNAVGVEYGMRDGNMVISIPSEITFASGKAELSKNGRKALTAVAKTLAKDFRDDEYWVEGHTDSDPIQKSKFPSNRDLSLARAMAVLHFLVEDAAVPDGQCVVAGWGEYRPVAQNSSAGNKSKNRRVEIVVYKR